MLFLCSEIHKNTELVNSVPSLCTMNTVDAQSTYIGRSPTRLIR